MSGAQDWPADVLGEGVAWAKGWNEARKATLALAEELRALGLADDFGYLKSDVNLFGEGRVCLNQVTADTALTFANLLLRAACEEIGRATPADDGHAARRADPAA
jgi:hypothetical protein